MSSNKRPVDEVNDQRQRRPRRRKHLYVALDDRDKDFSIHKIHADTFDSDSDDDDDLPMSRLRSWSHRPATLPTAPCPSPPWAPRSSPSRTIAAPSCTTPTRPRWQWDLIPPRKWHHAAAASPPTSIPAAAAAAGETTLYALSFHPVEKKHYFFARSWGPTAPDAALHNNPTEGWSWKDTATAAGVHEQPCRRLRRPPGRTHHLRDRGSRGSDAYLLLRRQGFPVDVPWGLGFAVSRPSELDACVDWASL
ncbi:hypothetical protein EJB05_10275, partial [Eragrostis curvula]